MTVQSVDGRELMQQLINAWTNVDRKDKYEFRLRVAKRKELAAGAGAQSAASASQPQGGIAEGPSGAAAGNEAQQQQECDKLKQELQTLQ